MSKLDSPLVITMGEPAGIGPELVLQTWLARHEHQVAPFVYIGDPEDLLRRAGVIGLSVPICVVSESDATADFDRALPVIPLSLTEPSVPGRPTPANAPQIIESISHGVDLIKRGRARAIVTNPIQKSSLYEANFEYPGHTEYLGHLASQWQSISTNVKIRPVMMLACEELRVIPATVHVALRDVSSMLTMDLLIETAQIANRDLKSRFGISQPRIAFTGLNPHASESGAMGDEEEDTILPTIRILQENGILASGPFPADTLFHEAARAKYDVVIAMYHDQALLPVKTIAFDKAVNVTLGLPFVRTSPDHGTALDIAGTGKANPSSLIAAIRMADTQSAEITG